MSVHAAPWKAKLQHSLSENASLIYSRYLSIATVKPDGRPANRTVVFRGFLDESNDLTFVTDRRSNKVTEVEHSPWAEMSWYFPLSREQYRIGGRLSIVSDATTDARLSQARQAAWDNLSDTARLQFNCPQPGLPRNVFDASSFTNNQRIPGKQEPPLPTFCLVVMTVEQVDHLQLFTNRREVYTIKQDSAAAAAVAAGASDACAQQWEYQDVTP